MEDKGDMGHCEDLALFDGMPPESGLWLSRG